MPDENCLACRFWELMPIETARKARIGRCRRHSPKLVMSDDGRQHSNFPLMAEDEWCGDFRKPKVEGDEQ